MVKYAIDRKKFVRALMLIGGGVAGVGVSSLNPFIAAAGAAFMAVGQTVDGITPAQRQRRDDGHAAYIKAKDAQRRAEDKQRAKDVLGPSMKRAGIPVTDENVDQYIELLIQYTILDTRFQSEGDFIKEHWKEK